MNPRALHASYAAARATRDRLLNDQPYGLRDLIMDVVAMTGESNAVVEQIASQAIDQIAAALQKGERIELRGFGVFEVRVLKAKSIRDPQGRRHQIPARQVVHFKPGKRLDEMVEKAAFEWRSRRLKTTSKPPSELPPKTH